MRQTGGTGFSLDGLLHHKHSSVTSIHSPGRCFTVLYQSHPAVCDYCVIDAVLYQIVLKAERRRGRLGEIAVDDFSLRRGACSDEHHRTE